VSTFLRFFISVALLNSAMIHCVHNLFQTLKEEQLKLNEELTAYKNRLDGCEQQKAGIKHELIQ